VTELVAGTTLEASRTYTVEMVEAFAVLSADTGRHHVERDERGRLLVHGLLVASLATELGGRIHYLARTMDFEFLRPVYTGDTITCSVRLESVEHDDKGARLRITGSSTNQDGVLVLRIASVGRVRKADLGRGP
jgi:acyl dehydratase